MAKLSYKIESSKKQKKLFEALLVKMFVLEAKYNASFSGLEITLEMDKEKHPYILLETNDGDFSNITPLVDEIKEDAKASGFSFIKDEKRFGRYTVYISKDEVEANGVKTS